MIILGIKGRKNYVCSTAFVSYQKQILILVIVDSLLVPKMSYEIFSEGCFYIYKKPEISMFPATGLLRTWFGSSKILLRCNYIYMYIYIYMYVYIYTNIYIYIYMLN